MINLDRCNGSCNTLDNPSSGRCVPNKTDDVNLSVFDMIIRINELKTLVNHIHANVNVSLIIENVSQF